MSRPRREIPWIEIRTDRPAHHQTPLVVDALQALGARLVERRSHELSAWFLLEPREPGTTDGAPFDGSFPNGSLRDVDPLQALASRVEEVLRASLPGTLPDIRVHPRREADWVARWTADVERVQITPDFEIRPPGSPTAAGTSIELFPGAGFGTAGHPTTRSCLQLLVGQASAETPWQRVLDVGAGSGLLSVAAALLGGPKSRVTAVERDPRACTEAARLARLNGVEARVRVVRAEAGAHDPGASGQFDLVLCNIAPPHLNHLLPGLRGAVRPGGVLLVSGIPDAERPEVQAQVGALPFEVVESVGRGGWWTFGLVRGSSTVSVRSSARSG